MCAILVTLGVCDTWKDAEVYIKLSRPGARLNKGQKKSLNEWAAIYAMKREMQNPVGEEIDQSSEEWIVYSRRKQLEYGVCDKGDA